MSHSKKRPQRNAGKFSISLMTIRKWHWMSSALCFICILLFSFTGITLNHAADIEASPTTTQLKGVVPSRLLAAFSTASGSNPAALPETISDWFAENYHLNIGDASADISDGEIYVSLARPGGDAWLSIDGVSGEFEYESTDRGWISYFNDLHKGRNTGKAWVYFMDVFAIACIIFSITGFLLLQRYADTRAQTWPLLLAGLLVPLLFMLFIIHR